MLKLVSRLVAGLAIVGFWSAPVAAETTLNASIWVPPKHPVHANMIVPWAEKVEEATGGNVKINILPKPVAGPAQHFDVVSEGQADVGFTVHGYTPGRFVLTKAAEFPFLGDSAEAISVAYWRIHEKYLEQANEHEGVKVLGLFTHGPGNIFNRQHPIESLSDLEGLKIRVGGGVVNDVAEALNVVPILKPAPASHELLSQGVVDGVFFPAESVRSFKLNSLISDATLVPGGLYNISFVLMMNPEKWQSLSADDQEAIMGVSGEAFARLAGSAWDEADKAAIDLMNGSESTTVMTASPELVSSIKDATAEIEEAWYREAEKKGVDGAEVMKALRAEIDKLEQ